MKKCTLNQSDLSYCIVMSNSLLMNIEQCLYQNWFSVEEEMQTLYHHWGRIMCSIADDICLSLFSSPLFGCFVAFICLNSVSIITSPAHNGVSITCSDFWDFFEVWFVSTQIMVINAHLDEDTTKCKFLAPMNWSIQNQQKIHTYWCVCIYVNFYLILNIWKGWNSFHRM